MPSPDPILTPASPMGRPADRIASGLAGLGLVGSIAATVWFFAGFYETDPAFGPASSAFLLALGLGAFAIVPSAVIMRLALQAWRLGFRPRQGWWTLLLALPWLPFGWIALGSDWLPLALTVLPWLVAVPLTLWALVSLWLERPRHSKGSS